MITLIGTGHVFRIAEPVAFIVKNIWPDAVLVELDESRYKMITNTSPDVADDDGDGRAYRRLARYQRETAKEQGSRVGAEFIAAVETGRTIGAAIEFIDLNASETMDEVWNEMSFAERTRFSFSMFFDRFRSKKKAEDAVQEFADNEERYFESMRKRYPTLVRKLIDERNAHMAEKIKEAAERYDNVVAVVGDGHVNGISKLIEDGSPGMRSIRMIRLKTLMGTEEMNALRAELWSGKGSADDPNEASEGRE